MTADTDSSENELWTVEGDGYDEVVVIAHEVLGGELLVSNVTRGRTSGLNGVLAPNGQPLTFKMGPGDVLRARAAAGQYKVSVIVQGWVEA